MTWLPILALGVAAMVVAVFVLKLPKSTISLFGAALLFGFTGYALQGSPGQPAAPGASNKELVQDGEALVDARRTIFDTGQQPARFILVSDAFARRGQYENAAGILQGAIEEQPDNVEAWTALANSLVEHAGGQLTPAALYAFGKAEDSAPGHPGPGYFLGVALLRSGSAIEARQLWAQMLENAPEDAPWREELALRLERLDELIAQMQGGPVR